MGSFQKLLRRIAPRWPVPPYTQIDCTQALAARPPAVEYLTCEVTEVAYPALLPLPMITHGTNTSDYCYAVDSQVWYVRS